MWPLGLEDVDFEEAIDFFRQRVPMLKAEWEAMEVAARKKAFTVAGVAQLDVVTDVWKSIDRALRDGTPLEEWKTEIGPKLEAAWAGSAANPPWRLETIFRTNVQCVLPDQTVEGCVVAASVARYAGEAVELRTKAGRRLAVTPNHPVLTLRGFVAAKELRYGDHVIRDRVHVEARPSAVGAEKREENGPSRIQDVLRALAYADHGALRARLGSLDLHGDAVCTDGYVHIVRSECALLNDLHSALSERVRDVMLEVTDVHHSSLARDGRALAPLRRTLVATNGSVRPGNSRNARFPRPRRPHHLLRVRSGAPRYADALERVDGLVESEAARLARLLNRISVLVQVAKSVEHVRRNRGLQPARLGPTSRVNASRAHRRAELEPTDADLFGELRSGFAGLVATDQIIEVRAFAYSGHVYDLQTAGGWYMAGGMVVSNCAYGAGRHLQHTDKDVLEERPVWMFDAVLDGRTSTICKECDGTVLDAEDDWWRSHEPPMHHACRSTVIALTAEQARAKGFTKKPPAVEADEGFGAPPGEGGWEPKLDERPKPLAEAAKTKTEPPRPKEHDPAHWEKEYAHLGEAAKTVAWGRAMEQRGLDMPAADVTKALAGFVHPSVRATQDLLARAKREKQKFKTLRELIEWAERQPEIYGTADDLRVAAAFAAHGAAVTPVGSIDLDVAMPTDPDKRKLAEQQIDIARSFLSRFLDKSIPLPRIKVTFGHDRGQWFEETRAIEADVQIGILAHELGHALESTHANAAARARAFLAVRTAGEALVKLKDIEPRVGYKDSELTRRDKFRDPYMGKQYVRADGSVRATEVTSMAFEWLATWRARATMNEDPESVFFALGQLAGR